jgi:hypothetical protein
MNEQKHKIMTTETQNQIDDGSGAPSIQKWKIFRVRTTYQKCCADCEKILGDVEMNTSVSRDDFLFSSNLREVVSPNENLLHSLVVSIRQSNNPFEDFDRLFEAHFKTGKTDRNLILMSLFERIFLRTLRLTAKCVCEPTFFELNEKATSKVTPSVGLAGVGLSFNTDSRNKFDIPQSVNIAVKCSNSQFEEFSLLVFETFNKEEERKTQLSHQISVGYLLGKVEQMFRITREDPNFIIGRRNVAYSYLTFVKQALMGEFGKFQNQRIQLHELVGKSGIGKSLAVDSLSMIVHALVPLIPLGDLVYTRANDYWWNGYCGQPIVLYDDFTHVKTKLKFDLIFELIAVASGTFRNPPMAFDKNVRFTSLLGVVTSNIPIVTTTHVVETIAALKRRIISSRWNQLKGLVEEDGAFRIKGVLLNSIEAGRSIFSLFSETKSIIDAQIIHEFSLLGEMDVNFDDDLKDSEKSTIPMLTSSVPESYSAMIGIVDHPREGDELVSANTDVSVLCSGKPVDSVLIDGFENLDIQRLTLVCSPDGKTFEVHMSGFL